MKRLAADRQSASNDSATSEPVSSRCWTISFLRFKISIGWYERVDHLGVEQRRVEVEEVANAARHAGSDIAPGLAEYHSDAAGHVLATVIAQAFDHAIAPELRTQKRSPTCPRMNSSPDVAPYAITLPAMMLSAATNRAVRAGRTTMRPPESPLAR